MELKEWMKKEGYTQSSLAAAIDVERTLLNRWINKKTVPRRTSLEKLKKLTRDEVEFTI